MKKILVCLLVFMTLICALSSALAGGYAPYMLATVLGWTGETYDIIEGQFKCVDLAPCTYYAMHNWSSDGQGGGGYAGFQYTDGQTRTLLSIWDTATGYSTIEYAPPGAVAERFGGEGEGVHVSVPYKWKTGIWYTMRIQAYTQGRKTYYEQWVKPENGRWTKLAVISYSEPNLGFPWDCFFLEDWIGNGLQRSCQLRKYYARRASDQQWESLTEYYVTCRDKTARTYSFSLADAATVYIQSGGTYIGADKAPGTLTVLQASKPDFSFMLEN